LDSLLAKIESSEAGWLTEAGWLRYDSRQKRLFNYIELNFELFERVYYLWQKKWIDAETWSYWEKWLEYLSIHPIFDDFRRSNKGMFREEFERYVDRLIEKRQSDT